MSLKDRSNREITLNVTWKSNLLETDILYCKKVPDVIVSQYEYLSVVAYSETAFNTFLKHILLP